MRKNNQKKEWDMWNFRNLSKRVVKPESESGQAIVLVALFMVVLLGMLGLAIDGGGMFLLWRDAQNAADTAVLQAAHYRCTSSDLSGDGWISRGETAAAVNGFPEMDPNSEVTVREWPDNSNYVEVIIEANKPAYFIQFVYNGPLTVRARSLAFCQRAFDPATFGGAVGLMPCGVCGANQSDQVSSTGSNLTFNGPMTTNCNANFSPGGGQNGGTVTGSVNYIGEIDYSGGPTDVQGGEVQMTEPVPNDFVNAPIELYMPGGEIYEMVTYKQAIDLGNDGLYPVNDPNGRDAGRYDLSGVVRGLIFVDGDVRVTNSAVWAPEGATIVATGEIELDGGDQWFYGYNHATTGDEGIAARTTSNEVYPSFLAYSYEDQLNPLQCSNMVSQGASAIRANGSSSYLWGVLYAPMGGIRWSGSQLNGEGALIAQKVVFTGSGQVYTFNPSMLPPRAPRINIVQ